MPPGRPRPPPLSGKVRPPPGAKPGTSILIVVGVGLDTVKQIQSQLQQRNYEGFLK